MTVIKIMKAHSFHFFHGSVFIRGKHQANVKGNYIL